MGSNTLDDIMTAKGKAEGEILKILRNLEEQTGIGVEDVSTRHESKIGMTPRVTEVRLRMVLGGG